MDPGRTREKRSFESETGKVGKTRNRKNVACVQPVLGYKLSIYASGSFWGSIEACDRQVLHGLSLRLLGVLLSLGSAAISGNQETISCDGIGGRTYVIS